MADHDYADDERKRQEQATAENGRRQEIMDEHLFPERIVPGGLVHLSLPGPDKHGMCHPNAGATAVMVAFASLSVYGLAWQGKVEKTRDLRGGLTIESPGQEKSDILRGLNFYPLIIRYGEERIVIVLSPDAIKRINDATAPKPGR